MAVAIQDVSTAFVRTGAGATTYTGTVNLTATGSLSNPAITMLLIFDVPLPQVTSVVWDSGGTNQALTLIANATNTLGSMSAQLWGRVGQPTAGNKNIKIDWAGSSEALFFAETWTGVDQTGGATSFANAATASNVTLASNATGTLTVTSATGNAVLAGWANDFNWASVNNTQLFLDNTGANLETASNRAAGAASVAMTATNGATAVNYAAVGVNIVAASGGAAAKIVEQSFFDTVRLLPRSEFLQGPFKGTSPPLSTTFATSSFFEPVKLKQPIISLPDIMPAKSPPRPVGDVWFEPIKLKRPIVDDKPPLFQPATVTTPNIVEQPFFEQIRPKWPGEFWQGPFAGTSPPLTIPYVTREFFDQIRLRPPILDAPSTLIPSQVVVVVNFSASNWFDAVKLFKVPERFGEFYPQQSPTPQPYGGWFDQTKLLRIPERLQEQFGRPFPQTVVGTAWFLDTVRLKPVLAGFDFTKATIQQVTIQNALTDWFATTKLKQPILDQPLVVYYPAQAPPPPDSGRPHNLPFMVTVGRFRSF